MTEKQAPTRYRTTAATAEYYSISRTTVYRLIKEGVLPVRRFPGRRSFLVDLDAADRVLNAE